MGQAYGQARLQGWYTNFPGMNRLLRPPRHDALLLPLLLQRTQLIVRWDGHMQSMYEYAARPQGDSGDASPPQKVSRQNTEVLSVLVLLQQQQQQG